MYMSLLKERWKQKSLRAINISRLTALGRCAPYTELAASCASGHLLDTLASAHLDSASFKS